MTRNPETSLRNIRWKQIKPKMTCYDFISSLGDITRSARYFKINISNKYRAFGGFIPPPELINTLSPRLCFAKFSRCRGRLQLPDDVRVPVLIKPCHFQNLPFAITVKVNVCTGERETGYG